MEDHSHRSTLLQRRAGMLIFLVALVVRLLYYYDCSAHPAFGSPILDSRYLCAQAQALAAGGSFPPGALFRPPLYTVALAGLYVLVGQNAPIVVPLIQHILGAVLCWLVYLLGLCCRGRTAGVVAGLFAAFYAPMVFYEGEILSDLSAVFLNTLFVVFWVLGIEKLEGSGGEKAPSGESAAAPRSVLLLLALASLVAGLAAITRPNIVPVYAIMVAFALRLMVARRPPAFAGWGLAATAIPFAVVVQIPTAYNMAQGDPVLICSQGGINFHVGNSASANGANIIIPRLVEQSGDYRDAVEEYAVLGYLESEPGSGERLRRYLAHRAPKPPGSELSRYWYGQAFSFFREDPGAAAGLYARKLLLLVNNLEVRNNKDFHFVRKHVSGVLKWLPLTFGTLFPLALLGAAIVAFGRGARVSRWLLLFEVLLCMTVVAYFVAGRMRFPVVPLMFVFAGIAMQQVLVWLHERRLSRIACAVPLMGLGVFVSFYSWPRVDFRYSQDQAPGLGVHATSNYAGEFAMLAMASLDAGHPADALALARRAAAEAPTYAYAQLVAGNAAYRLKLWSQAEAYYGEAVKLEPRSARSWNNLAAVLEEKGALQEAVRLYERAIEESPFEARALGNLAILHARSGQTTSAMELASRALEIDPALATARLVLAHLHRQVTAPRSEEETRIVRELLQPISPPLGFVSPPPR